MKRVEIQHVVKQKNAFTTEGVCHLVEHTEQMPNRLIEDLKRIHSVLPAATQLMM